MKPGPRGQGVSDENDSAHQMQEDLEDNSFAVKRLLVFVKVTGASEGVCIVGDRKCVLDS